MMLEVIHYIGNTPQLLLLSTDKSSTIEFAQMWCLPVMTVNNPLVHIRLEQIFQENYRRAKIAIDSRPDAVTILSKEYPDKTVSMKMMLVDTSTKQRIPCYSHPEGISMDDFSELSEVISIVAESIPKKSMQQTIILPIVLRMIVILPMKEETLKGIAEIMNRSRKKDKVTLLSQV